MQYRTGDKCFFQTISSLDFPQPIDVPPTLHKDRLIKQNVKTNSKPNITRFKGLGEMNPDTLKHTTLDTKTRQVLRVTVKDGEQLATDQTISDLMGKDVAARFKMITENAAEIGELDV